MVNRPVLHQGIPVTLPLSFSDRQSRHRSRSGATKVYLFRMLWASITTTWRLGSALGGVTATPHVHAPLLSPQKAGRPAQHRGTPESALGGVAATPKVHAPLLQPQKADVTKRPVPFVTGGASATPEVHALLRSWMVMRGMVTGLLWWPVRFLRVGLRLSRGRRRRFGAVRGGCRGLPPGLRL